MTMSWLFGKKREEAVDIDADIEEILRFLEEVGDDLKEIYQLMKRVSALRKKELAAARKNLPKQSIQFSMQEQIRALDRLLQLYQFLDIDTEINGKRLKKIGRTVLKKARKLDTDHFLIDTVSRKDHWKFNW
jgi:hypothetical protein